MCCCCDCVESSFSVGSGLVIRSFFLYISPLATSQVLGTFITEAWEDGRRLCESMLASPTAARAAADQLVALAVYFGFEGWLVNVENGLGRDLVPHLITFVSHLRSRLSAVVGPHAMVVW